MTIKYTKTKKLALEARILFDGAALVTAEAIDPLEVPENSGEVDSLKAGNGRRPYPLMTMRRIHCLHKGYNLSDPANNT